MAANGDRKSTGSNFGCTLCSDFSPFLFPIIQRRAFLEWLNGLP
jgi:hypothetical protein